jgi:uncharacterized protein (DUF39 family)
LDYGVPSRNRPVLKETNYEELRSGKIVLGDREIQVTPLSSFKHARKIAETLKKWIEDGRFLITQPVERLSTSRRFKPLDVKEHVGK